MLPLVTGVQEACARIGNVPGQGLARNIKNRYSLRTLRLLVTLLAVANVINIGADIGALGASAGLLAVFLIAGPMAALGAGGCAYHAGITAARAPAAPAVHQRRHRRLSPLRRGHPAHPL